MSDDVQSVGFFNNLGHIAQLRHEIADHLGMIAQSLTQAESEGETTSGKLGLEHQIERLVTTSETLRQGVFRLLVLGDMKRGKSTFLNALLGQKLLPSDVNPCTALLTVVKYGAAEQVTLYYNDGKQPEAIDFEQFKQRYTINPDTAKALEQSQQLAFPTISHAVVEHPLPLLGQGIEFVDSPGLNDTEARNQLSLGYIYNCHAILFVLSASQPCTLDERRYLQNYLKERGLTVFFLINGWDRIRDSLIDPDDTEALHVAEEKLRQVFRTHLADYCYNNQGEEIYSQRVFAISALEALRTRLKAPEATLEGTGFSEFLNALNHFLMRERTAAELTRVGAIAHQAYRHFHDAVERRIPLMGQTVEELKQKIDELETDFNQLADIHRQFQDEIRTVRDRKATEIADSFKTYILDLEKTFEQDFLATQPDLDFRQFMDKNNRAVFYTSFKRAFERYLNDRFAAWEFMAKQKMTAAFTELEEKAADYRLAYEQVIEVMNRKVIGYRFYAVGHSYKSDQVFTWSDVVMDMFSSIPDHLNGAIRSFNGFWQSVLTFVCGTIILQIVGLIFASLTLSVFGTLLAGVGVVVFQADYVRRQFIGATKTEFVKYLPQIAEEQWQPIHRSVRQCFDAYEEQVRDRISADINARKAELDNLLQQKQSQEIDGEAETQRLRNLEREILSYIQQMESLYANLRLDRLSMDNG